MIAVGCCVGVPVGACDGADAYVKCVDCVDSKLTRPMDSGGRDSNETSNLIALSLSLAYRSKLCNSN